MDGELLPNSAGLSSHDLVNKASSGNFTKRISNLTFTTVPDDKIDAELYVGQFCRRPHGRDPQNPTAAF